MEQPQQFNLPKAVSQKVTAISEDFSKLLEQINIAKSAITGEGFTTMNTLVSKIYDTVIYAYLAGAKTGRNSKKSIVKDLEFLTEMIDYYQRLTDSNLNDVSTQEHLETMMVDWKEELEELDAKQASHG